MLFIVLPAYNEEGCIDVLLRQLHIHMVESRLDYRALVVNDGSTDATEKLVLNLSQELPVDLFMFQISNKKGTTHEASSTTAY